jgi:nucleoside-diphosphate-sugar epimerase
VVRLELSRIMVAHWTTQVAGADAVVNAAGLLRGDLASVQATGPIALFHACAEANVRCVLQISALGAGEQTTTFLSTKAAADRHLLKLAAEGGRHGWHVLRPSLVIGRGGVSIALFSALAALPIPVRLGRGAWRIQPIHVADLARVVADLAEGTPAPEVLNLVGPEEMTTVQLTAELRGWLGLQPRPFLPLPEAALRAGAGLGNLLPGSNLTRESLAMLAAGSTADLAPLATALGWRPRRLADAMAMEPSVAADRLQARLAPVRGVMLASLVAVWVGSGVASLLLTTTRASELLAGLGLQNGGALATTWASAIADILLGAALVGRRRRGLVLKAQLVLMAAYTFLATIALPGLWFDPFGSLLKNLAVLSAVIAHPG